jgi:hypothetical protein
MLPNMVSLLSGFGASIVVDNLMCDHTLQSNIPSYLAK